MWPLFVCTGGPRISWFQNSWSPPFRDSVSGINFVKSPPFRDFESKKAKKKNILEKFSGKIFGIFFSCLMICYCSISYSNVWTIKFLLYLLHESCPDKFQHSTCFSTHYCNNRDRLIYPQCNCFKLCQRIESCKHNQKLYLALNKRDLQ